MAQFSFQVEQPVHQRSRYRSSPFSILGRICNNGWCIRFPAAITIVVKSGHLDCSSRNAVRATEIGSTRGSENSTLVGFIGFIGHPDSRGHEVDNWVVRRTTLLPMQVTSKGNSPHSLGVAAFVLIPMPLKMSHQPQVLPSPIPFVLQRPICPKLAI
jgi:hypothetical protein